MLDGVDPGADRGLDPGRAMGMGGDSDAPLMGLVGDGAHLGFRKLLLARLGIAAEHAAGGADLDHFGTELALASDLVAKLLHPVANAFFLVGFFEAGRKEGAVAMATGRAERIAGGDDPRTDRIAILDRLLEPDVVAVRRADIAHRGEAGIEHRAGIADRDHAEEGVSEFQPAIAADVGRAVEVDVHVDQARDEGLAGKIDVADVGAPFDGARVGDAGDAPVIADEDGGMFDIAAGGDIEITVGGDDALFGRSRGGEQQCRHCDADRSIMPFPCCRYPNLLIFTLG